MGKKSQAQHLLGLSGTCATALDAARLLHDALPALQSLGGADAVLVVRRGGEGSAVSHATGTPLEAAPVEPGEDSERGILHPVDVPGAWQEHGIAQVRRPAPPRPPRRARAGLVGRGRRPRPSSSVAAAMLETALARLEAASDLHDLTARVDNAQHLAHMGDYDWHIPSDTNRWSDELFRIYGHEPQSFNPSYEKFLSLIHPDDRERITGVHQQAYATGEPYQMMERIVRPDGEVRYLASNGEVVMDEHGVPQRMRGTCIDITDRVHAERDREHLDARYRGLVEAAPDAILVLDGTGHVVDANPKARALLLGDPTQRWVGDLGPLEHRGPRGRGHPLDGSTVLVDVTRVELNPGQDDSGLVAVFLRDTSARLAGEELAAHQSQAQLRRRQALEINDNVVQGLVAAAYALDAEQYPVVASYVDRTLSAARAMMDDLLEPLDGQDLDARRPRPHRAGPDRCAPQTASHGTSAPSPASPAGPPRAGGRRCRRPAPADARAGSSGPTGYTVVGEAADGIAAVELARELQPDLVLLDLAMPRMDGLEALPLIRAAVPGVRVIVFSGFNQNTLALSRRSRPVPTATSSRAVPSAS